MKSFLLLTAFLVSTSTATLYEHGAVSTQYQHLDPYHHTYSYGYSDPNSKKEETRTHDGVTRGTYSYVDGYGHVQSVSYIADPHFGFQAVGSNLPKAPVDPNHHVGEHHAAAAHHYVPYARHYSEPIHHVTLTPAGVPVDTPEVQHARAAHFAAYAAAAAAAHGDDHHHHHHHLYKRSLYSGPWAYGHQAEAVTLTHGGVPVETPDVQAAKAEHFAAHAKILGQLGHGHGAPIDTPDVQHAKAAHFAAHSAARYGSHVPVIHNGVPVDTPEVQHAKAVHYAASARSGHAGAYAYDDGHYGGHYDGSYDGHQYKGPIHIPIIHNGVPVEPLEVQNARASHLNALAAASHRGAYHHGAYHGKHEDDGQYHSHYDRHY